MQVDELESSLHLYQPPLYRAEDGSWHAAYNRAVTSCGSHLTLDPAAVLSILSFGYSCGNRTLLREIELRPWLSKIGDDGEPVLETIPAHGRISQPTSKIAENLGQLLCEEAYKVCQGRKEIYVLLSGGLDSRIVAGVLAKLAREGRLSGKPIAVTWGLEDSRDVFYARVVSKTLGFEQIHIDLGPEDIRRNIKTAAIDLAGLVSPEHLHSMPWFQNISEDALVLSGSYGDSVGRAEFSKRHLLEADYLRPVDTFGFLKPDVLGFAHEQLMGDLKSLHNRTPGQARHVLCEHEMQGHYMRRMLAHTMNIINKYCTVYQMFTDPSVYGYMWSIHPALRTDDIYAVLLEHLDEKLARIPWSRTNRALKGATEGARSGLRREFHNYAEWSAGPLYDEINQYVTPDWFAAAGIFNAERIQALSKDIRYGRGCMSGCCQEWLWLASFRCFVEHFEKLGKCIEFAGRGKNDFGQTPCQVPRRANKIVRLVQSKSRFLTMIAKLVRDIVRKIRKYMLMRQALRKYPPESID